MSLEFPEFLIFSKCIYIARDMKQIHALIIGLLAIAMLYACKEEQSCTDGVYSPDEEEALDCGGVCPPCPSEDSDEPLSLVLSNINGVEFNFSNYNLIKDPAWILSFSNDTISVALNFGNADSLGTRNIDPINSNGAMNGQNYSLLVEGSVLFSAIDHTDKRLSGFFQAKFLSDQNNQDTLVIKNGDFENVLWE